MTTHYRLLLVEDDEVDAENVQRKLASRHVEARDVQFDSTHVTTIAGARRAIAAGDFDVILLDLGLPDSSGLDSVAALREAGTTAAIVVLTLLRNEGLGLDALRCGVEDFLPKDGVDAAGLVRSLLYAVERSRLQLAEQRIHDQDREEEAAGVVQEHLLPAAPPKIPGFDIAARCQPASHVGGDLFDFVPLENGGWAIVVADVSGHGLAAALTMAGVRQIVRTLFGEAVALERVATVANDCMFRETTAYTFVTMMIIVLDPIARTIRYIGAGHRAYLIREGEAILLDSTSMALGFERTIGITVAQADLRAGDVLLIPTDGLEETRNGQGGMFGSERLCAAATGWRLASANDIVERVFEAVEDSGQEQQADDRTLVVLKVLPD